VLLVDLLAMLTFPPMALRGEGLRNDKENPRYSTGIVVEMTMLDVPMLVCPNSNITIFAPPNAYVMLFAPDPDTLATVVDITSSLSFRMAIFREIAPASNDGVTIGIAVSFVLSTRENSLRSDRFVSFVLFVSSEIVVLMGERVIVALNSLSVMLILLSLLYTRSIKSL